MNNNFRPLHMNATAEDLKGNQDQGRYVFLPGSDGRAQQIAEHFINMECRPHPRGHNLYIGQIKDGDNLIDVATIASGMGCPSMEIILHELLQLGARRILRVGTSGSLQHHQVTMGDFINVQAAVRDESTTVDYAPIGIPAIASMEYMEAIRDAAKSTLTANKLHTGTVHCKASFYAREFEVGPRVNENNAYLQMLTDCNVLASEMETATLFIQSQVFNQKLSRLQPTSPQVIVGALLGIIAMPPDEFADKARQKEITDVLVALAIESTKQLYRQCK